MTQGPDRAVLRRFALAGASVSAGLAGDGGGATAWLLRHGSSRLVLRRLPAGTSEARARFATGVQSALARACRLAPAPILASDGRPYAVAPDGLFALSEYVPGTPASAAAVTEDRSRVLGRCLGSVHRALEGALVEGDPHLMRLPDRRGKELRLALARLGGARGSGADAAAVRLKLARLSGFDSARLDGLTDLPRAVIHGDFHRGNVVIEGDRAVVVDLDRACEFWRCYEVVRGAVLCALVEPGDGPGARSRFAAFLRGYGELVVLSDAERSLMFDLYVYVQLGDAYCLTPSELLPEVRRRAFRDLRMWSLAWVESQRPALSRLVEAAA